MQLKRLSESFRVIATSITDFKLHLFPAEVGSAARIHQETMQEPAEQLLIEKPDLKVLLNSGYNDFRTRFPEIQERNFQFISKPYKISTLLSAVGKALS